MHGVDVAMEQAAAIQFGQNSEDAAGAVHILHVHVGEDGATLQSWARGARGGRYRAW